MHRLHSSERLVGILERPPAQQREPIQAEKPSIEPDVQLHPRMLTAPDAEPTQPPGRGRA
jgi:hypothetical protein